MLAGQTSQDRTVRLAGSSAASLLGTAAWSSCSCCLMGCAGASEPWSPSLRGGLRSCQMCGSRCFTPWLHRGWGQRGAPGSPVRGVGHSGCSGPCWGALSAPSAAGPRGCWGSGSPPRPWRCATCSQVPPDPGVFFGRAVGSARVPGQWFA